MRTLCGYGSLLVKQALAKYGKKNFTFTVLQSGDESFIRYQEQRAIATCLTRAPRGYNLTKGGEGTLGMTHSEETRKKMSDSRKGTKNAMFGRKHSEQTKELIASKRRRRVLVNGREFPSITEAAKFYGRARTAISNRLRRYEKTGAWPTGWAYLE